VWLGVADERDTRKPTRHGLKMAHYWTSRSSSLRNKHPHAERTVPIIELYEPNWETARSNHRYKYPFLQSVAAASILLNMLQTEAVIQERCLLETTMTEPECDW